MGNLFSRDPEYIVYEEKHIVPLKSGENADYEEVHFKKGLSVQCENVVCPKCLGIKYGGNNEGENEGEDEIVVEAFHCKCPMCYRKKMQIILFILFLVAIYYYYYNMQ